MSSLQSLSQELSGAVAAAGESVVALHAGQRRPASGVVWRSGVIVTTDHGLEHDEDIVVGMPDGSKKNAKLAGRDPSTDLAVVRVEPGAARAAAQARADSLRIGHIVLAIGRSPSDGVSASMGVLSALDGPWTTWRGGRVDRFIRADVTAYPGYSGGPLVDASGAVIGINTTGLSRNWPLTVPSSTVDRVADTLLSQGRIARGYLGVGLQPVRIPENVAAALKLHRNGGAIVLGVEGGSPAERGGVMIGDVLVALDGQPITDVDDLHSALGPERVGADAALRVIRAGALTELRVTVGERPDSED
jgi:serine protease DegQ